MRVLLAIGVLATSCGTLVAAPATDGADAGSPAPPPSKADGGTDAPPPDAGLDATFCQRRAGDLACEDFDQGHGLPLIANGDAAGIVVADPTTTSPPNAFESTSPAANALAIAGYFVRPFDDFRSYAFDFDYRIVAPSSVTSGALFAYVDFQVGGQRTTALEIRVDSSPAASMQWDDIEHGQVGTQIAADVSGSGPWYHLSFTLDATGAKSSHGVAAPPQPLTGEMYLVLGIVQNPTGGSMTVRYDSATVR
ncbi:MAG TPA: hypothetical protein VIF62_40090 [Labilithrix sp.]